MVKVLQLYIKQNKRKIQYILIKINKNYQKKKLIIIYK